MNPPVYSFTGLYSPNAGTVHDSEVSVKVEKCGNTVISLTHSARSIESLDDIPSLFVIRILPTGILTRNATWMHSTLFHIDRLNVKSVDTRESGRSLPQIHRILSDIQWCHLCVRVERTVGRRCRLPTLSIRVRQNTWLKQKELLFR